MTPSFMGRTAMIPSGVRPSMRLASSPTPLISPVASLDGDDGRLVQDDALALHVDERVGRAEIDGDVVRGDERTEVEPCHFHRPGSALIQVRCKLTAGGVTNQHTKATVVSGRCSRSPPPPAPVARSASARRKVTDSTRANTSWAMRMPRVTGKTSAAQVDQGHLQFAPVIAVDRGRRVGEGDPMLEGQTGPRPDLALETRRDGDGESGADQCPGPGCQLDVVRARDVIPRRPRRCGRGSGSSLSVGQPDDFDVDHAQRQHRATSTSGSPNASATPGYTTLPFTTFRPRRSAPSALQSFLPAHAGQLHPVGQRGVGERQCRGAGHATRHVRHAIVQDAVDEVGRVLVRRRLDGLDATALVHRHVHDDGARPHELEVGAALTRFGALAPGSSTAPMTRSARLIASSMLKRFEYSVSTFAGRTSDRGSAAGPARCPGSSRAPRGPPPSSPH